MPGRFSVSKAPRLSKRLKSKVAGGVRRPSVVRGGKRRSLKKGLRTP